MRISRTNYAILTVLNTGLFVIIGNLAYAPFIFLTLLLFAQFYLVIGRLKDMNASPFWSILTLLPFVSFVLMFPKGTQGINQYGEDPRVKRN